MNPERLNDTIKYYEKDNTEAGDRAEDPVCGREILHKNGLYDNRRTLRSKR